MPGTKVDRLITAIKKREDLRQAVATIEARYQPRITRLTEAMNLRTYRKRNKIRTLTTTVKINTMKLSGGELSRLRRMFPLITDF